MECLNNTKIQDYVDGNLNSVENSMARDHLIVCASCRKQYQHFETLEKQLQMPIEITPPSIIERHVLQELFPKLPTYSSILALIAASFVLLITSIYIYFDFANNSIVQAIQLTSSTTSNWIAAIIKFISTVFSSVYAVFEIMNRFLNILFKVNLGAELLALIAFVLFSALFYPILKVTVKKIKG